MKLKYYHGIIDIKGIDWFRIFDGKMLNAKNIRVRANSHRHAKSYMASMTEKTENDILNEIDAGHYMKAMKILKNDSIYLTTRDEKGTPEEYIFLTGMKEWYEKQKMVENL